VSHRGIFGLLLCVCAPATGAADEWGGSVAVVSDYVFRGLSQTRGAPALQAGAHWRNDEWLAGLWGSTMNPNAGPGRTLEMNAFLSRGWRFGADWHATMVAVHYFYPNNSLPLDWDYDELIGSLAFRDSVVATIAWSPNSAAFTGGSFVEDRRTTSYELSGQLPLWGNLSIQASAGYGDTSSFADSGYGFWSAGVAYDASPWQLALSHFATSGEAQEIFGAQATDDRWALSVQWRFRSDGGQ
jgi:uncharacterized protein (TIGR02001 family)